MSLASAEVRDNTYSNLLSLLTLCPTHQASLKERGLTRDEIDWLGYESRGNLAAGKRTADQIILLKDYDPEIIRNFVERVRVYPSGEIEIDMRTSSGFEFVTAS